MRPLYIFILAIFIGISTNAQTVSAGEPEPYDYATTLQGGYTISFKVDDSLQYLYLQKEGKTIRQLASTSKGMLYKNLGYVAADFKDYFVLAHSFGAGNPHQIELVQKTTGKNSLKEGASWIDASVEKEVLLYSENATPGPKDRMTLYNIRTGEKQSYSFPAEIFDGPEILNRIQIKKVTDKQLIIRYDTQKGPMTKVYNR